MVIALRRMGATRRTMAAMGYRTAAMRSRTMATLGRVNFVL